MAPAFTLSAAYQCAHPSMTSAYFITATLRMSVSRFTCRHRLNAPGQGQTTSLILLQV